MAANSAEQPRKIERPLRPLTTALLLLYALALGSLLGYFIVELWPSPADLEAASTKIGFFWDDATLTVSPDTRLVMLVLAIGGLGGWVHFAQSFGRYVGHRTGETNWIPYWVARPFLGAALAVLIYAVLRGGLLASGSGPEDINAFGFAAIAGLTGLSSEAASNKLQALFKELFGTVASESANEDQSLSGSTGETAEGSGEDENPVRT